MKKKVFKEALTQGENSNSLHLMLLLSDMGVSFDRSSAFFTFVLFSRGLHAQWFFLRLLRVVFR